MHEGQWFEVMSCFSKIYQSIHFWYFLDFWKKTWWHHKKHTFRRLKSWYEKIKVFWLTFNDKANTSLLSKLFEQLRRNLYICINYWTFKWYVPTNIFKHVFDFRLFVFQQESSSLLLEILFLEYAFLLIIHAQYIKHCYSSQIFANHYSIYLAQICIRCTLKKRCWKRLINSVNHLMTESIFQKNESEHYKIFQMNPCSVYKSIISFHRFKIASDGGPFW